MIIHLNVSTFSYIEIIAI